MNRVLAYINTEWRDGRGGKKTVCNFVRKQNKLELIANKYNVHKSGVLISIYQQVGF